MVKLLIGTKLMDETQIIHVINRMSIFMMRINTIDYNHDSIGDMISVRLVMVV